MADEPHDPGTREPTAKEDFILSSYRYLRLAIIVLLSGLFAALAFQQLVSGCIESSISAYYYSPVHALFIGALVATGAAMIALKGRTTVEDTFFNVAGFLAPVVALVPTTRQPKLCDTTRDALNLNRDDLVPNSLFALLVAALVIVGVTIGVAMRKQVLKERVSDVRRALKTAVVPSLVYVAAGVITVFGAGKPLYTFLHFGSAVGLFVAIYLAIFSLLSKRVHGALHRALTWEKPTEDYKKPVKPYLGWYTAILYATAPAAALAAISGSNRVFWLEVVGVTSFAVFWGVQTFELWDRLPDPEPPPTVSDAA